MNYMVHVRKNNQRIAAPICGVEYDHWTSVCGSSELRLPCSTALAVSLTIIIIV